MALACMGKGLGACTSLLSSNYGTSTLVLPASAEQMYPRHILEHKMAATEKEPGSIVSSSAEFLASSHQNVTIMFMDIVGEGEGRGAGNQGI